MTRVSRSISFACFVASGLSISFTTATAQPTSAPQGAAPRAVTPLQVHSHASRTTNGTSETCQCIASYYSIPLCDAPADVAYYPITPDTTDPQTCKQECNAALQSSLTPAGLQFLATQACQDNLPDGTVIGGYSGICTANNQTAQYTPVAPMIALLHRAAAHSVTHCPSDMYSNIGNVLGGTSPDHLCKRQIRAPNPALGHTKAGAGIWALEFNAEVTTNYPAVCSP
jgi:hypothetical protein